MGRESIGKMDGGGGEREREKASIGGRASGREDE